MQDWGGGGGGAVREQAHPSTSPSSWYAHAIRFAMQGSVFASSVLSKLVYETVEMLVSDTLH